MLRGFLIVWLIVSNLGYGVTLLADVHHSTDQDSNHNHTYLLGLDEDHAENTDDCDHCCHGLTHLLGMVGTALPGPRNNATRQIAVYTAWFSLPPPHKPFRPPIAA